MENALSISQDSNVQLVTTFESDDTSEKYKSSWTDALITINGIFSNSRNTWIVLATNMGFAVFDTKKSIKFLKQSSNPLFEVKLIARSAHCCTKCRNKHIRHQS